MIITGTVCVAGLRKEFAQLKLYTSPQYKFEAFSNPNNALRNRYKDVVCLDSSRVILDLNVPPESDYIHANNVKLEGLDRSYIATQGPLESTISDFWRLVHQESVTSIVMLCKCIEDGKNKCSQYFPAADAYKNYGCMFVNNKKTENTEDKLFIHSIEALPDGCSNSTAVKLFQMNDWPDRGVPEKPMSILRLLRQIPSGRCIVKEMFQTLRNQRASAVQAESQYVLIHTCVINYIRAKMPGKYKESAAQFAEDVKNAKLI
uniref:Tyrosine-protein phosphatase domain-containing protein n=1 Tax=Panagrolaimus davidi TaxID=227884 RepID=A0A914Q3M4_9BILA